MKKIKKTTVKDIDLFHLILEAYGWDEIKTNSKTDVHLFHNQPEAVYAYNTRHTKMVIKFHEPLNMISLWIEEVKNRKQNVQLHFMYDEHPERILEWVAKASHELSIDNYPVLLKDTKGKCEMMLLELSNSKMYEVIPPAN